MGFVTRRGTRHNYHSDANWYRLISIVKCRLHLRAAAWSIRRGGARVRALIYSALNTDSDLESRSGRACGARLAFAFCTTSTMLSVATSRIHQKVCVAIAKYQSEYTHTRSANIQMNTKLIFFLMWNKTLKLKSNNFLITVKIVRSAHF